MSDHSFGSRRILLSPFSLMVLALLAGVGSRVAAAEKATPPQDRPPPWIGYTEMVAALEVPVLVLIPPPSPNGKSGVIIESLNDADVVMRATGGRVSRGHFLPYAQSKMNIPFYLPADEAGPTPAISLGSLAGQLVAYLAEPSESNSNQFCR